MHCASYIRRLRGTHNNDTIRGTGSTKQTIRQYKVLQNLCLERLTAKEVRIFSEYAVIPMQKILAHGKEVREDTPLNVRHNRNNELLPVQSAKKNRKRWCLFPACAGWQMYAARRKVSVLLFAAGLRSMHLIVLGSLWCGH